MIRSMTGYGRAEGGHEAAGISIEMRSVNNRFLDVQVKMPRTIAALETRIRKAVQDRFSRGRIDVFINRTGKDCVPFQVSVNHQMAGQYLEILRDLKGRFDLDGEINLTLLSSFPDIIVREEVNEDMDRIWEHLAPVLERAMNGLAEMRNAEGAALGRDMAERIRAIEEIASAVAGRGPEMVAQARKRMQESLQTLLAEPVDAGRIAQEIAMLAERTDVTEELTRLGVHVGQFRTMMAGTSAEPVGRKLDFLLQEMGREVNTIASKALDAEVSLKVVNIKAELEKVREQVQNIE